MPVDPSYPKHFHGLGIRIEVCRQQWTSGVPADQRIVQDDIAFTKDGPMNLSAYAPKEIVDIEGVCQGLLEDRS